MQELEQLENNRKDEERAAKGIARAQARAKMHAEVQAARLARAKQMHEVRHTPNRAWTFKCTADVIRCASQAGKAPVVRACVLPMLAATTDSQTRGDHPRGRQAISETAHTVGEHSTFQDFCCRLHMRFSVVVAASNQISHTEQHCAGI